MGTAPGNDQTTESQSLAPPVTPNRGMGSLPTPIDVDNLEKVLSDHPDQIFVFRLCQTFREEANIGFSGHGFLVFREIYQPL